MDDIREASILGLPDGSLDEIFAEKVGWKRTDKIAAIMGVPQSTEIMKGLEADLLAVLSAFFDGQIALVSFRPLKEENKMLDDVRKHCDALCQSLESLYQFGKSTPKLVSEIKSNHTKYTTPSGIVLADLLDSNRANPFRSIRELISDLSISAERSIIKKPRVDEEWRLFDELTSNDSEAFMLAASQNNELVNPPKLDKEHALRCAVFAFKKMWGRYSSQPFTEGMYYPETKTTLSPSVDAIEVFMENMDPSVTRQNIVSAIKWLKSNELPKSTFEY